MKRKSTFASDLAVDFIKSSLPTKAEQKMIFEAIEKAKAERQKQEFNGRKNASNSSPKKSAVKKSTATA
jgi:hypothetical protein